MEALNSGALVIITALQHHGRLSHFVARLYLYGALSILAAEVGGGLLGSYNAELEYDCIAAPDRQPE